MLALRLSTAMESSLTFLQSTDLHRFTAYRMTLGTQKLKLRQSVKALKNKTNKTEKKLTTYHLFKFVWDSCPLKATELTLSYFKTDLSPSRTK